MVQNSFFAPLAQSPAIFKVILILKAGVHGLNEAVLAYLTKFHQYDYLWMVCIFCGFMHLSSWSQGHLFFLCGCLCVHLCAVVSVSVIVYLCVSVSVSVCVCAYM